MKLAVIIILAAISVFLILPILIMSYIIYRVLLVRTSPDKWEKETALIADGESTEMAEIGAAWEKENNAYKIPVTVKSGKLNLYGEYFDFGFEKAVIIIAGRMESCTYSYFFAEPYKDAGFNVLVIDNQGHGKSDGKRSKLGFKEQYDIIEWGKLLYEKYGVLHIVLHGICIGASTAMFALTNKQCPDYIDCIITEGMYTTFHHTFVNHMIVDKRPVFPFAFTTMLVTAMFSGGNPMLDGPVKRMPQLDRPALFMHSKEDKFSLPEASEEMYNTCKAYHKTVWFDKGAHSRIKINNRDRYDSEIKDFLCSVFNNGVRV